MSLPFWLWIPLTIGAAAAQTLRNALQRGLIAELGQVGATAVRFLFGLPASAAFFALASILAPQELAFFPPALLFWLPIGAIAQILATFFLLEVMERRNFAVGIAWSKTEILLIGLAGWLFLGDRLGVAGWFAVLLATLGLILLSAERMRALLSRPVRALALRGLAIGVGFALAAVAYRAAILAAGGAGSLLAASWTLLLALALQSSILLLWLLLRDPGVLMRLARRWRSALGAGTLGALASAGWFTAFSLAPAAAVRTVGLIEMLIALLIGRGVFNERASRRELLGQLLVAAAVLLMIWAPSP